MRRRTVIGALLALVLVVVVAVGALRNRPGADVAGPDSERTAVGTVADTSTVAGALAG